MSKRKTPTTEECVKEFEKAFEGVDFDEQPAQPNWNLVYLHSAMEYIREHHPQVYEECGDTDEFRADRLKELEQPRGEATLAPVPEAHKQQEPVGTVKELFTQAAWERLDLRGSTEVYTSPPAQQQEPVAYIRVSKTGNVMACAKTGDFYKLPDKTLLYTSPPIEATPLASQSRSDVKPRVDATTWRELTDEEKAEIKKQANYNWETTAGEYASKVQALTEAKLREKNA